MHHARRALALFALLLASATAGAQTDLPSFEQRTGWPLPQSGIYYDPAQGGVGFSFDVGLDGSVLGGFASYGPDGRSIFHTVQGRITRDGLPDADRGIVGVLRSPLYLSRRIGAPGAADARVVTEPVPALGEAVVRFVEPRRLTLDIGGQRWNMQRVALTEDPAQWISGRFLMLVEPRPDAALRWPVLAEVSIGQPLRVQALPAPNDRTCAGNAPVAEARFVECLSGCGAFQEWAGGRTAQVVVWANPGTSTYQLGRYVPGADGLVPLADAAQYTLSPSPLALDALPQARGCTTKGEALRLYRKDAPSLFGATPGETPSPGAGFGSLRGGTWWDPSRPGRGLVVDVGGRVEATPAVAMVGVFDFGDDGSADFSTVQGGVRSIPALANMIGLESPLYAHRDGQCIGCPWRAPVTSPGSIDLQLYFADNFATTLTVRRMSGGVELGRNQYVRFPIDRSAFDEVQGRWLLRIADPALTATSTDFATIGQRIPVYAEVMVERADGTSADPLGGSPVFRLRCTAGCSDFERWKRLGAVPADPSPREAVLVFERNRLLFSDRAFETAAARLFVGAPSGSTWVPVPSSPSYHLNLLQRDRYSTNGTGSRADSTATAASAGTIDLFRNPPRVFAD